LGGPDRIRNVAELADQDEVFSPGQEVVDRRELPG
jgi:hypothetical protein